MRTIFKKAALLEFSTGHMECLYSQASFLKNAGYEVHLICPSACRNRVLIFDKVDQFHFIAVARSNRGYLKQALGIRRILKDNDIRLLVINTFMGKEMLWLIPFMRYVRMACILHWLGKLKKSVSLRIIQRKVRRFFVLSDHLLHQIPERSKIRYQAIYPMFMPEFPPVDIKKSGEDFWICIPGQVEYRRRNYQFLLEHLDGNLHPNIKFILLGNLLHPSGDGLDFKQRIARKGLLNRFVFFKGPIEDKTFQATVKHSDLIMPLLAGRPRYLTSAISGAFNLAFFYKVPMLVEKEYSVIEDLRISSITYSPQQLAATLNDLYINRTPIRSIVKAMTDYPVFNYNVQQKRYVDFLETLPWIPV